MLLASGHAQAARRARLAPSWVQRRTLRQNRCRGALVVAALAACCAVTDAEASADAELIAGNDHYTSGNLVAARASYMQCLQLEPERTDCATNLASVLIDLGGNEVMAEELYRRVLSMSPGDPDASFNLASVLQDKKTDEATREAAELYETAIKSDASRWDAWANLATALAELKEAPLRAIAAFEQSILLLEEQQARDQSSSSDAAFDSYLAKLYYSYGMALSELTAAQCLTLAQRPDSLLIGKDEFAREARPDEAAVRAMCVENAANALRTVLQLNPSHLQAEHMLASLMSDASAGGGDGIDGAREGGGVQRASPAFVQSLFDDFSDTFDQKLAALEYAVPRLLADAVAKVTNGRGGSFSSALDAGCGTGLAGLLLRPMVRGALIGVDLSEKMLRRAGELRVPNSNGVPVYDRVLPGDLLQLQMKDFLSDSSAEPHRFGFELITAADVLVYFGELLPLLSKFAELSSGHSALVFSCERATEAEAPKGWKLTPSGRFVHTKQYVVRIAGQAGYTLRAYEEITPRMEGNVPVRGHMFTFEKD